MIIMYVPHSWFGAEVGSPKQDKTGTCSEPRCTHLCITWDAHLGSFDVKGVEPKVFLHLTQSLHLPGRNSKCFKPVSHQFNALNVFEAWGWHGLAKPWPSSAAAALPDSFFSCRSRLVLRGILQTNPSKAELRLVVPQLKWSPPPSA